MKLPYVTGAGCLIVSIGCLVGLRFGHPILGFIGGVIALAAFVYFTGADE